MSACLTCAKSIDCNVKWFAVDANQEIRNALCKHFWFGENQYLKSTICYPCWHKIEEFHRFYCEVEELHSKPLFPHVQLLEIKQENVQYDSTPEQAEPMLDEFVEADGGEACMSSSKDPNNDDDDYKQKYDDKRPRLQKHQLDAVQEYAREHKNVYSEIEKPMGDEPSDDEPDDEDYKQESDDSEESYNLENNKDDDDDKDFSTANNSRRHAKTRKKSMAKTGVKRRPRKAGVDNEKMIAENVNLECDSCKKKFSTFLALQKHSTAEHNKLAYVFCCSLKFKKKPRLIDHILFHLDPSKFQCKICHKNLRHTESLKRHMDKNHAPEESKTLQCTMCPKMFTHQKFLNTHIRYHKRRWHCEICDKRFICEATLKQHHKSIHTKELSYVCHVCARTFHIYSSYRSHLETHDESVKKKPQKPRVQCTVCNAWTQKLTHHMRLHSGTQTCEICGKECKNEISYRYHMKNHETGDYICSVCGKGFKREITLKEHMASHTGDVLYSCDFCDRTFNSNANKASHRKKMHPQQWLEDKIRKKAAKLAQFDGAVPS